MKRARKPADIAWVNEPTGPCQKTLIFQITGQGGSEHLRETLATNSLLYKYPPWVLSKVNCSEVHKKHNNASPSPILPEWEAPHSTCLAHTEPWYLMAKQMSKCLVSNSEGHCLLLVVLSQMHPPCGHWPCISAPCPGGQWWNSHLQRNNVTHKGSWCIKSKVAPTCIPSALSKCHQMETKALVSES